MSHTNDQQYENLHDILEQSVLTKVVVMAKHFKPIIDQIKASQKNADSHYGFRISNTKVSTKRKGKLVL